MYASLRNYSLAGDVLYFPVRACGKNGSPVQSHLIDTCVTDLAPPLGAVFPPSFSLGRRLAEFRRASNLGGPPPPPPPLFRRDGVVS